MDERIRMELARVSVEKKNGSEGGAIQIVTQAVGLLAGLAGVIYAAGAVVLTVRLWFEGLPWGNVVSQLPREFLLSIGAGQVLLPSLAIGAGYGVFRLLHGVPPSQTQPPRFRDGGTKRRAAVIGFIATVAAMAVPGAIVILARIWVNGDGLPRWSPITVVILCGAVALLFTAWAVAIRESRAGLLRHQGVKRWSRTWQVVAIAGLCTAAAIPAMLAAAAFVPFTEAKICTTGKYTEHGLLVGETSDRIYLGEQSPFHRRLAVIPLSKVDEMFFGDDAQEATCEWPGPARELVTDNPPPDEADGGNPVRGPRNAAP